MKTELRKFSFENSRLDTILNRADISMSINRFGSRLKSRNLSECRDKQQYNEARFLKLSATGNYDFQNKTLENLNTPENDNDAVSKIFMENYFNENFNEKLESVKIEILNQIKEYLKDVDFVNISTPLPAANPSTITNTKPVTNTTQPETISNTNTPTLEQNLSKAIKNFGNKIRF